MSPGITNTPRVRLLHWNAKESTPIHDLLSHSGFQVDYNETYTSTLMRAWRETPPDAFIIDLSRLPSQGMEIAIALRQSPKTKQIPIIFCGGAPEKLRRIQDALPDATYCTAKTLVKTLKSARPLAAPVQPPAMMDRYSQRTTAQKLGISEEMEVAVINPPRNLSNILGPLPRNVKLTDHDGVITLCFVHSVDDFRSSISEVHSRAVSSKLWVIWCKKASPKHNGVTDGLVRDTCLGLGLVDYKICSLDQDWTGMLFAPQKP